MKAGAEAGRRRREAAEAAATPEERVVMYVARKEKMRELKKQEVRAGRLAGLCERLGFETRVSGSEVSPLKPVHCHHFVPLCLCMLSSSLYIGAGWKLRLRVRDLYAMLASAPIVRCFHLARACCHMASACRQLGGKAGCLSA